MVALVGALEAAYEGVSGGEVGGRGELSGAMSLGRSPASSGRHGENMGVLGTGRSLFNSCLGPYEEWRCSRGVVLDIVGRLGELWREGREKGGEGEVFGLCSAMTRGRCRGPGDSVFGVKGKRRARGNQRGSRG